MKSRQKTVDGVERPVVMHSLDGLIPYARNARTHSDAQVAQIAASIREFGWTNPVLIDEDGGIIAGHGRVLAARLLGQTEVPCIALTGLTKTQRRAYVLADNQLATKAGWDNELLSLELADLKEEGFDLALTGFDDVDPAEFGLTELRLVDWHGWLFVDPSGQDTDFVSQELLIMGCLSLTVAAVRRINSSRSPERPTNVTGAMGTHPS